MSVKLVILLYSPTVQMGGSWVGGWVGAGGLWKGPVGFLGRGWGHELSVRVRRAFAVLGLLGCRAAVYVLQEDFLSDWPLDALPHSWQTNTHTHTQSWGVGNKLVTSDAITNCLNKADQGEMLL